ncbi:MAG TPA: GHMP kinase [Planctomycetaceae bacterium]|nr:GHMP kinase [Planctomycetaceae bacterium]
MIISRTPYRISFFGGGTDYPSWYHVHGGAVLAASIDKYCYLTCRYLPPFFEHRSRVVYSKIESCQSNDDIAHPSVREVLRHLGINRGVEIHHDGDLPARSGMGSSSAFTVGLLHAAYALQGQMPSKRQLALESIHVEQNLLKETVGSQDQVMAAYGGLQHVQFLPNGEISVRPLTLPTQKMADLNDHLMLFYTGIIRTASDVAKSYVDDIHSKRRQLRIMKDLVDESISILNSGKDLLNFGQLLHEAWLAKRSLSAQVSNPEVDELYSRAQDGGAIGGKLTGAGGGGFLLLFVPPEKQDAVKQRLQNLIHVPFRFEPAGSQIIFYEPGVDYSAEDEARSTKQIDKFRELTVARAA